MLHYLHHAPALYLLLAWWGRDTDYRETDTKQNDTTPEMDCTPAPLSLSERLLGATQYTHVTGGRVQRYINQGLIFSLIYISPL